MNFRFLKILFQTPLDCLPEEILVWCNLWRLRFAIARATFIFFIFIFPFTRDNVIHDSFKIKWKFLFVTQLS
ncbi:MAG: hypothetical protein EBS69_07815 [Verrucomicrobia bacterium]|nr:hypothetical protein [Verrucomicrobiota bacterium]